MVRISGRGSQAVNASWFGHGVRESLAGSRLEVRVDPDHREHFLVTEHFHRFSAPTTTAMGPKVIPAAFTLYFLNCRQACTIEPQAFDPVTVLVD